LAENIDTKNSFFFINFNQKFWHLVHNSSLKGFYGERNPQWRERNTPVAFAIKRLML
jgi:hypothetical protein